VSLNEILFVSGESNGRYAVPTKEILQIPCKFQSGAVAEVWAYYLNTYGSSVICPSSGNNGGRKVHVAELRGPNDEI
jgi:hypothetical protein